MSRLLLGLQAFVGVGAMAGGLACILNPEAPLGAPVEMLSGSPFTNFLIPGIILFTVLGLGNIIGAVATFFKSKYHGCLSHALGWALMIWIVVQCIIIKAVAALHIIFFTIGLIEAILSAVQILKQKLFPVDIVLAMYKKLRNEAV